MKELLRDFFQYCFDILKNYPILTGILILIACVYLIGVALPKAYGGNREYLYPYYSKLGLVIALIFFLLLMLLV